MKCPRCLLENQAPMIDSYDKKTLMVTEFWEKHFTECYSLQNFEEVKNKVFEILKSK